MRVALLALDDSIDRESPVRVAGRSIAWHQMRAAIGAGCERIVCLADGPGPDLASLQEGAEAGGARFHAISHARALSGLVQAADTLLIFARAVLPDDDWMDHALAGRTGVAVFPADRGVAAGYERIDRDRAWAGVVATRGDSVEALAQLPPDADPLAGLLRVALQRGVPMLDVPVEWLDSGRWAFLATSAAAQRFEPAWYTARVPPPPASRPGERAAYGAARRILARSDAKAGLPGALAGGALALAAAGGLTGYFASPAAGFALLSLSMIGADIGRQLARFARGGDGGERPGVRALQMALVDLGVVASAAAPFDNEGWAGPFAALVLVAMIRMARERQAGRWLQPFGDRALVIGLLAAAALAGVTAPAMAAAALIALAIRLFAPARDG